MTDSLPPAGDDAEPTRVEGAILDPTVPAATREPDLWSSSVEVLPGAPVPPADRPRGRGFTVLVAAAVAALAVGGGTLAWAAFNRDTGDQPEKHLPANAGAMIKVDLDPSGSQKIDALRFFRKFPAGSGLRDGDDPRRFIYERLASDDPSAPPWSEVEPWLGQRLALAVLPGDGGRGATPVALLEVTDEATAKATLAKATDERMAFAVSGGWATIADTQAHVDAVTSGAADRSLAEDATFHRDVEALGDSGVVTGWADASRLPALRQGLAPGVLGGGLAGAALGGQGLLAQRYALVARFTGGDAEVVLRSFGTAGTSMPSGAREAAGALPDGTVAAVAVSGAGDTVGSAIGSGQSGSALAGVLADARRQTGLDLPGDLEAVLGRRVALALAEPDASGRPVLGLRGESDAAGLGSALDRLLRLTDGAGLPLERRDVPGGYVLATDRAQADAMARDGRLGRSDAFRDAVVDADGASFVAYVDVERLLGSAYGKQLGAGAAGTLGQLRAVGLVTSPTGDGTTTTLRVTTR